MSHEHDHNCECGCEHEVDVITLTLDDGSELECEVIGICEANGYEYIALLPLEADEESEDGKVFLYRYSEDENGEVDLATIEDDAEFEAASAAFDAMLEEMDEEEEEE